MLATGGNVGLLHQHPYTLSVGSTNTGTFGIATTTDGCAQFTKGLLWITGSACGSSSTSAPAFTPTSYGASTSTTLGLLGGLFSLSSTTLNGLKLSDLSAGFAGM
jgi:hypothetical protein